VADPPAAAAGTAAGRATGTRSKVAQQQAAKAKAQAASLAEAAAHAARHGLADPDVVLGGKKRGKGSNKGRWGSSPAPAGGGGSRR
jgi:hypothetical protein